MAETTTTDQFAHVHQDATRDLELLGHQALERSSEGSGPEEDDRTILRLDVAEFIRGLARAYGRGSDNSDPNNRPEPRAIFRRAVSQLSDLEMKHFVVTNLLESLKRGEPLGITVKRFARLGLINRKAPSKTVESTEDVQGELRPADVRAVKWSLAKLRKAALLVGKICINAVKAIPQMVEVKPSLHLAAGLPIPTLTFEGHGLTLAEAWDLLSEGIDDI
jgi:hypothetical protein